jgi:type I restriction enzyme S subunit
MSWQTVKLGDVCDLITDGTHISPVYSETGVAMLDSKHIKEGFKIDDSSPDKFISIETDKILSNRCKPKTNDILISSRGSIGKIAIVNEGQNFNIMGNMILLRLPEAICHKFLAYQLSNKVSHLISIANGVAQKGLYLNQVRAIEIPLPPISEQKRIAAILDKADEIRRNREQAITKLEQLAQSIFVEMFGDLVINNKAWEFITISKALKLGAITGLQDGNHGESHPKSSDFVENGTPFIMANCLINGKIDYTKAYKLDNSWLKKLRIGFAKPNDVLISHKGTVGEVAIVSVEYQTIILSPQTTYYRTSDKLNSTFLAGYFKNNWFQSILKKEAIQSTRAYIGITRQKDLPFFLPPIALQEEFAKRINQIEKLKADNTKALANHNALFASLQQQAFSGNL